MATAQELRQIQEAEEEVRRQTALRLSELEQQRLRLTEERKREIGDWAVRAGLIDTPDQVIAGALLQLKEIVRRANGGETDAMKQVQTLDEEGTRFFRRSPGQRRRPKKAAAHAQSAPPSAAGAPQTQPPSEHAEPDGGKSLGSGSAGADAQAD